MPIRATRYVVTSCGARREEVLLTSQRPWSSHGEPVAVVGGKVLTPGEAGTLYTDSLAHRLLARYRNAGYQIRGPATPTRIVHPNAAERDGWGFW
jgi:hypothetical protein